MFVLQLNSTRNLLPVYFTRLCSISVFSVRVIGRTQDEAGATFASFQADFFTLLTAKSTSSEALGVSLKAALHPPPAGRGRARRSGDYSESLEVVNSRRRRGAVESGEEERGGEGGAAAAAPGGRRRKEGWAAPTAR